MTDASIKNEFQIGEKGVGILKTYISQLQYARSIFMKTLNKMCLVSISITLPMMFTSPINASIDQVNNKNVESTTCYYVELLQEINNEQISIAPTWWPGNPNPQPGTEDWMFQNQHYAPPSDLAKKCAIKAMGGGSLSSIGAFLKFGASIGLAIRTFGVGWAISYTKCIFGL